jgi:hypothetical protein
MKWIELELIPFLDLLSETSKSWDPDNVISNTLILAKSLRKQLDKFQDGNYRADRNEILGFFDAIERFSHTDLPFTLEHYQALINDYKRRILPYPHYSGIKISVVENLSNLDPTRSLEIQ